MALLSTWTRDGKGRRVGSERAGYRHDRPKRLLRNHGLRITLSCCLHSTIGLAYRNLGGMCRAVPHPGLPHRHVGSRCNAMRSAIVLILSCFASPLLCEASFGSIGRRSCIFVYSIVCPHMIPNTYIHTYVHTYMHAYIRTDGRTDGQSGRTGEQKDRKRARLFRQTDRHANSKKRPEPMRTRPGRLVLHAPRLDTSAAAQSSGRSRRGGDDQRDKRNAEGLWQVTSVRLLLWLTCHVLLLLLILLLVLPKIREACQPTLLILALLLFSRELNAQIPRS